MLRNGLLLTIAAAVIGGSTLAESVPITGTVEAKCSIYTDTPGIYGNPLPNKLSTTPSDGGVLPVIRYDVASADFFKAKISHPISFSSGPSLTDTVTWTGSTTVTQTSVSGMSAYNDAKIEYDNVTEFDLTLAGSTWFSVASSAMYGYNKSFPAGTYNALVTAECIAK